MNLNEKCLINYLQKPDELLRTTEFLKLINKILEKKFISKSVSNRIDMPIIN